MKHTTLSKGFSLLLVLAMALSLFAGLSLTASAANDEIWFAQPTGYTAASDVAYVKVGNYIANWGVREEPATFLTTYAANYYTGNYTFETLSSNQGNSNINSTPSSALYKTLQNMMRAKATSTTSYQGTRDLYKYTDCMVSNYNNISSFYSGIKLNGAWDSGKTWNREHCWPESKCLTSHSSNADAADIMMLRPTSVKENSNRGNTAYGESSGFYFPNSEANGNFDVRGDCARICLYVYVRWGNTGKMWGSSGVMENLDVLLKWMEEDPVDTWEMGRNDAVQSIIGVRNVFVDYPEFAWLLFGQSVPVGYPTPSTGAAPAHEHACALAEEVPPTCTENGTKAHLYCAGCGKSFSLEIFNETGELVEVDPETLVIPALGHDLAATEVIEPTCTEGGCTIYSCSRCDYEEFKDHVEPLGHDLVVTEVIKPTCTTYGYTIYNCSRCDYYEFNDNVEAFGHDWDEGVVTVEPTEESEGEILYTCRRCGATQTDILGKLEPVDPCAEGHDWGEPEYVWAEDYSTCTATHICKTNPEHIESETVNTRSEVTLLPTVEAEGEMTYTAEFGNKAFETQTKVVAIPKLDPTDPCANGHDWDEPTYVWAWDYSTCTATRVCKNNPEHVESETAKAEGVVTVEPTEESEGEIIYTAEFENEAFGIREIAVALPMEKPENPTDPPFEDVEEGKYFYDAVIWAVNHEPQITKGTDDTHFAPGNDCTRGQVVTFLWRAHGCEEPASTENPFEDVEEGKFYYEAVLWAVEKNITKGVDDTHFGPGNTCTRGQVVTFLWRAAGEPAATATEEPIVPGEDETPIVPINPDEPAEPECPFTDVDANAFYYKAMLWAVANEITKGTSDTTFAPGNTCTRGQVVTFLYRADGK